MTRMTGKLLNKKWGVGAQHALYREDGKFFMPLERFPGALFDSNGYVVFENRRDYENSPHLRIGSRVNVSGGIASIPSYVKMK
jgi:5-methylcytosine-specific restriction enzyme A